MVTAQIENLMLGLQGYVFVQATPTIGMFHELAATTCQRCSDDLSTHTPAHLKSEDVDGNHAHPKVLAMVPLVRYYEYALQIPFGNPPNTYVRKPASYAGQMKQKTKKKHSDTHV